MDEREEYLVKRIKDLEAKLDKTEAGVTEVMMLTDALMVQMAMEFGVKEPDGGYRVKLPVFNAKKLAKEYQVSVEADGLDYVLRVHRLEA